MSQSSHFIERIWYQGYKGYGAYYLLLPLSVLFALISALRRLMFRFGVLTAKKTAGAGYRGRQYQHWRYR